MIKWSIYRKNFQLLYNWKLSRNEAFEKTNFFIKAAMKDSEGWGEVAPNIRYGETEEIISQQFNTVSDDLSSIHSLSDMDNYLSAGHLCQSLRFGIESALTHLLAHQNKRTVQQMLKIPLSEKAKTCYTIPVMLPAEIQEFYLQKDLKRFSSLKIKVDAQSGLEAIQTISKLSSQPLKIDANEAWESVEDFLVFQDRLKPFNIEFVEQPFPAKREDEYKYLKRNSKYPVFGDESVIANPDWNSINEQFHGVNIKLMKAGGYSSAIRLLKEAKKRGLKTMIGCMVETTLGIYSALQLTPLTDYADLDGFMVIRDEPFQLVRESQGIIFNNSDQHIYNLL